MVTTPFKSAVAARAGGRSDRETYSSSSSSGVGGGGGGGGSSSSLRRRKLRMLESAEPSAVREALSDLSPATTLVVTIDYADAEAGGGGGECCREMTSVVREWLLAGLMNDGSRRDDGGGSSNRRGTREEEIVRKHMYLVTGNEDSCRKWSNPDNAFLLPRHSRCEAFGSFSAAGILVSGNSWVRPAK
jgi:hypothetical protein